MLFATADAVLLGLDGSEQGSGQAAQWCQRGEDHGSAVVPKLVASPEEVDRQAHSQDLSFHGGESFPSHEAEDEAGAWLHSELGAMGAA